MGKLRSLGVLLSTVAVGVVLTACASGEIKEDATPIEDVQEVVTEDVNKTYSGEVSSVTFDNEDKQINITYGMELSEELRTTTYMYILAEMIGDTGGFPEDKEEEEVTAEYIQEVYPKMLDKIEKHSETIEGVLDESGHPGYSVLFTMENGEGTEDYLTSYKDGNFVRVYEDMARSAWEK